MMDTNRPLRFGMVGCGRIARLHVQRIHADGRAELVAVCDNSLAAAKSLVAELAPHAAAFDSLRGMLDAAPLDAVLVATPTHLHYEHVLACLKRGVPVLCEKPLADTRERILALIAAAESARKPLAVAYQRRGWAIFRTLRRELHSLRWGAIRAVTSNNIENWQQSIAGTWRDDPAQNIGGFIGDAGSHKIDTVFYVTGLAPQTVFAQTVRCGSRVEVIGGVVATLDGAVPLTMSFVGNAQNLGEELFVHCEAADLFIRDGKLWIARTGDVREADHLEPETNPVSAFIDLLQGGENLAPPECALPVFDFTQAILKSAECGARVRVGE